MRIEVYYLRFGRYNTVYVVTVVRRLVYWMLELDAAVVDGKGISHYLTSVVVGNHGKLPVGKGNNPGDFCRSVLLVRRTSPRNGLHLARVSAQHYMLGFVLDHFETGRVSFEHKRLQAIITNRDALHVRREMLKTCVSLCNSRRDLGS